VSPPHRRAAPPRRPPPARPVRALHRLLPAALPLLALLAAATPAAACPPLLAMDELPPEPNPIELGLGATNANAAIGSGRLTATLSRCGEITSLKWPGPSYYDQLDYLATNTGDARTRPHFGALDSMGAFAGLWLETSGGGRLTWLRDAEWERSQRYTASTSGVVENLHVHPGLGLRVVVESFVLPDDDVLVQRFRVWREPGSPVTSGRLLWYGNFAPTLQRFPEIPIADMGLDFQNDFVALYDAPAQAVLHFTTGANRQFSAVNPLLQAPPDDPGALASAVQTLSASFTGTGAFLAYGFREGDDGHQVGFDDAPTCAHQSEIVDRAAGNLGFPGPFVDLARNLFSCDRQLATEPLEACRETNGWSWEAESAWHDVRDGTLSGSPIAACRANAALARELELQHGAAEATLYLAAASTRAEALSRLAAARAEPDPGRQLGRAEREAGKFLAAARLPASDDPTLVRFARRALLSLRTATDSASGAMVASVAAQPPYGLDWPRDGAFFNHALDLAGLHDLVTRHQRFYLRVQRKEFQPWSFLYGRSCPQDPALRAYPDCVPPGTFQMNYYADPDAVVAGGPISFEIDNAGLIVWSLWDHAGFLEDPVLRTAYLDAACPAIALGADSLADCRDPATGLQCPSSEDDNFELSQGLQGAETVLLALRSAADAAPSCGFDLGRAAAWQARSDEIEAVIRERFRVDDPVPHLQGPRRAWALWPARVLHAEEPLALSHVDLLHAQTIVPLRERTAPRAGYNAETLIARAQLFRDRGDLAALASVREDVRLLLDLLTTPDTGHMAEFAGRVDKDLDGDGVVPDYLPQNDVPHVWQQMNLYLAAMLAYGVDQAPPPLACDVDGSAAIDLDDLDALAAAAGTSSTGLRDPRDADEDGRVTAADVEICRRRCNLPNCGFVLPACGLLGAELLLPVAAAALLRRRSGRRSARHGRPRRAR